MSEQILVNVTPFETRVAIMEQGTLQEVHIERTSQRGKVGNVYIGKVVRVLPGMQSAFVDIGLERAAFIHIADLQESRVARNNGLPQQQIEKILFEGQSIMVQVIKDAINNKGARLSNQISIAGRFLVYMPFDNHIGVSQKIEDDTERERLKNILTPLLPPNEKGGYIIRTQAEMASEAEIQRDVEYLCLRWQKIKEAIQTHGAPSLIYQDLDLLERVMRDMVVPETISVEIDSRSASQHLIEWSKVYTPDITHKVNHYTGIRPLFDTANIDDEINAALSRRVDLKSGGYLVIDQTEALTSIDVNTGGFVGWRNFNDTIFKTNLEASIEIARQLRLRNLGGIIIIDFIDMDNPDHQEAVLSELQKALAKDRTRTTLNGFSPLGLVEMTRKRSRDSLTTLLTEPCPTCDSRGYVKTARTVAYTIMREILREAKQFNPKEFRLILSPQVIDLFLDEESNYLAMLDDFIGKPISLEVDNSYTQEMYDIVLL
ncbi:ribonuclease G [Pelistega europaea]|uniref:Ribonuclease G n=1 Tax=Pelistega europaea TaxID=106147 RepID=A0A7Y4P3J5_9BURK|nr:ribonuclease G [Pelistega europaea]NOL49077.1 ribonuclease G [Pelistega europaea]